MGSWDATCGITHLPILTDEPCRFLFLRQVLYTESGWQHPMAQWLPLSLPVKGVYDGHGRVVHERESSFPKDPLLDFQVETFERVRQEITDDKYDYFQEGPLDNLITMCERGVLQVNVQGMAEDPGLYWETKTVHVAPYYVSEPAWNLVVNSPWRSRMVQVYERAVDALRRTYTETARMEVPEIWEADTLIAENLLSSLEANPDVFVLGTASILPDTPFESLSRFSEKDWKRFAEAMFDLQTFHRTIQHNLRRTIHPELYSDQFRFADLFHPEKKGFDLQKELLQLIAQRYEELGKEDDEEEDE